jgi:hypothetical protein
MNARTPEAERPHVPSAGAVLLWCINAGGLVALLLLVEPPEGRGLEFWDPSGTLRLLSDLLLFYCIFVVPALGRRGGPGAGAMLRAAAVVLFTGTLGLVALNYLVGIAPQTVAHLVVFLVVVAAGAMLWAAALEDRPGVYYSVAGAASFGVPVVAFFLSELFRIEAHGLDVLSPFSAWRVLVDAQGAAWGAWAVFGVLLVSGAVAAFVHVRRKRA